jgi:SAM-dependent methyltransferase
MRDAQRAATILYGYGAHHVWVFGSLAQARVQDRWSDLDLAVEGLPPQLHSQATGEVFRVLGGRVDVVPLETVDANVRWAILRHRLLLPRVDAPAPATFGSPAAELPAAELALASLYEQRLAAAVRALSGARHILDAGCGHAWLVETLARQPAVDRVTGVDFSAHALRAAGRRLKRRLAPAELAKVTFVEGLLTWRDPRYAGHDGAAAIEVIEHLAAPQQAAFEAVLFGHVGAAIVVVTTPNREYNDQWHLSSPDGFRHHEHRFEWRRDEFAAWAAGIGDRYGYAARIEPVGTEHPALGAPTQLATFRQC